MYYGYIGRIEKKTETTIIHWGKNDNEKKTRSCLRLRSATRTSDRTKTSPRKWRLVMVNGTHRDDLGTLWKCKQML